MDVCRNRTKILIKRAENFFYYIDYLSASDKITSVSKKSILFDFHTYKNMLNL